MRAVLLALTAVTVTTSMCAQQAERPRPRSLAPEWVSLFNGQDLTGWNKIGKEKWVVEDGVIYGEGITEEYGYLATEGTYRDFHLKLSFKCEADGNSGVYIHTAFEPGTPRVTAGTPDRDRPHAQPSHRRRLRRWQGLGGVAPS